MTALSSSAMSSASEGDSAQSTQEDATVADVDDHVSQSSTINRIRNTKKEKRKELIRAEGGPLAFDTKYGALNPYAIYYGLVSILLGLVWYVALSAMQLVYLVTGNRFDRKRRIPIFLNHLWGTCLLRLTGAFPVIENRDVLLDFYKQKKAAMFIANHNSWMDIPYLGATIGWRNYKFVAKKELEKVPILGKAIALAMNVCVDRSNRRSQIKTLKSGMQWLKDGVHLCTFPEGTRSRSGRLMKFKNGAFKMAHKIQAPVVPLSIVASGKVMPSHWMFPLRPGRQLCKVVVHDPIDSVGKTEEELATEVRDAIIKGLPKDQLPSKA